MNYRLLPEALNFISLSLKDAESSSDIVKILKIKEPQIKNVIKINASNGILTLVAMVEYIKINSTLKSESQILERVHQNTPFKNKL